MVTFSVDDLDLQVAPSAMSVIGHDFFKVLAERHELDVDIAAVDETLPQILALIASVQGRPVRRLP